MPFLWDEIIASASFHLLGQQTRPCFHPSAKECTGEAHSEAHSSPAGKMAANSTVAVVYSGHLGVVVPEAGALARRFLVDPLRASVFVAGQHAASVTGGHNWVGASAHACPGLPALWPASTRLC